MCAEFFQDDQPFFFLENSSDWSRDTTQRRIKFVINFFLACQTSPPLRVKQEFVFRVNYVKSLSM